MSLPNLFSWEVFGPTGLGDVRVLALDQAADGTLTGLVDSLGEVDYLVNIDTSGPTASFLGELDIDNATGLTWTGDQLWIAHDRSVTAYDSNRRGTQISYEFDHEVLAVAGQADQIYAFLDDYFLELVRIDTTAGTVHPIVLQPPIEGSFRYADADFDADGKLWVRLFLHSAIGLESLVTTLLLEQPDNGNVEMLNFAAIPFLYFIERSLALAFGPDPIVGIPTLGELGGVALLLLLAALGIGRLRAS